MSFINRAAATVRARVEQAKHEFNNITWPPDRAQREADNRAHDEAERRNTGGA